MPAAKSASTTAAKPAAAAKTVAAKADAQTRCSEKDPGEKGRSLRKVCTTVASGRSARRTERSDRDITMS